MRLRRVLPPLLALLALVTRPGAAPAQDCGADVGQYRLLEERLRQIKAGRTLRLTQADGGTVRGELAAVTSRSLILRGDGSEVRRLALGEIRVVWERGRSTGTGALIGAGAGVVAGAVLGALLANLVDETGDPDYGSGIAFGVVVAGAGGAALGAAVGAVIPKWRRRYP